MQRWLLAPLAAVLVGAAGPSRDLTDGIKAYNRGDVIAAARLLGAAAGRGEAEAMVNLGYMYARGHGVPQNPAHALELYRRAAELGDAEGMNAVGYRYDHAAKPDLASAIDWYCRAMAQGSLRAINNLAILFSEGRGVSRDRAEARRLWREAAKRGSSTARYNLATDVLDDIHAPDNERTAAQATLDGLTRDPGTNNLELMMRLEPVEPILVSSRVCGALVS